MTRKTKFHKVKVNGKQVIFRDLTVLELSYLLEIKSDVSRNEMAAKVAIHDSDVADIPWPILQQIGKSSIEHSAKWISDKQLFEILVKEYREELKDGTSPLSMIKHVLQAFPGQSVTELLKLTWKDLVELTCLAEEVLGRKIFNVAGMPNIPKQGTKLVNPQSFEDDGMSLQQKMDALNASLGGIPR